MLFVLSKTVGFFAHPSNAVAVICAIGLVLLWTRWRRAGVRVLGVGVALLLLIGYSPLGSAALLPLAERFPPWQFTGRAPDGIIVLGGSIDSDISVARSAVELDASAERILAMLELGRQFPNAKIVFSGGSANLIQDGAAEAPIAGDLLARFGVAPERVVLESKSRTTVENAAFTRELVAPQPGELWLLVTSAFHMPRSIGAFRTAGFDVVAHPVDWRTRGWIDLSKPFTTLAAGLARSDVAAHEWAGLLSQWLAGKSRTLLPAP